MLRVFASWRAPPYRPPYRPPLAHAGRGAHARLPCCRACQPRRAPACQHSGQGMPYASLPACQPKRLSARLVARQPASAHPRVSPIRVYPHLSVFSPSFAGLGWASCQPTPMGNRGKPGALGFALCGFTPVTQGFPLVLPARPAPLRNGPPWEIGETPMGNRGGHPRGKSGPGYPHGKVSPVGNRRELTPMGK